MGDSAKQSDEGRENAISEEKEATSNVISTTTDHRGDDVGTNGQRVDDAFKLSMEGTEATPLPVTSKILQKVCFLQEFDNSTQEIMTVILCCPTKTSTFGPSKTKTSTEVGMMRLLK